jgi:hypothetical protein
VFKRYPEFLPDGNHYFYTVSGAGVYLADLQNTTPRKILPDDSAVVYVAAAEGATRGYVLFLRDTALMAQSFDEKSLDVVGDPFVLVNDATTDRSGKVAASAAADGTLVYGANSRRESQLTWVDRSGMVVGTLGFPGRYSGVGLSPKGNYAVAKVSVANSPPRLQLFDLVRGRQNYLTPSGASFVGMPAVWSEDESSVLITMTGSEGPGLYRIDVATGKIEFLEKATDSARWDQRRLSDWSPDGKLLIYTEVGDKTRADIWSVPMESGKPVGQPVQLVGTDDVDSQGQLSPDGKWLAFVSGEFQTSKLMVRSLLDSHKSYTLGIGNGALEPRFDSRGQSVYFFELLGQRGAGRGTRRGAFDRGPSTISRGAGPREGRDLRVVALQPDGQGGLRVAPPESLPGIIKFRSSNAPDLNVFKYSPHPDGRFLVVADAQDDVPPTIQVISNGRRFIADRHATKD